MPSITPKISSKTAPTNLTNSIPKLNNASIKDLKQGASGELLWNNQELQLKANSFQQINAVLPITISGSNNLTIESLWKPSAVTASTGITALANDTLGTLTISVDSSIVSLQSWVTANFLSPP